MIEPSGTPDVMSYSCGPSKASRMSPQFAMLKTFLMSSVRMRHALRALRLPDYASLAISTTFWIAPAVNRLFRKPCRFVTKPSARSMSFRILLCISVSSSFPAMSSMQSGLNDEGLTELPMPLSNKTSLSLSGRWKCASCSVCVVSVQK